MESQKLHQKSYWSFSNKVVRFRKIAILQPSFGNKSFFDKLNFKNNLLLKLGCKIAIFLNLTTLFKKLQKNFWCNFCDSTSISFIVMWFSQKTNKRIHRSSKNELVSSFLGRIRGYQKSCRNYLTFNIMSLYLLAINYGQCILNR